MSITVCQLIVLRSVIGVDCEHHVNTYTLWWSCKVCNVTADHSIGKPTHAHF